MFILGTPRTFVNVPRHSCNKDAAREPDVARLSAYRDFGYQDISNIDIKETLIEDIATPIRIRTEFHNGVTVGIMSATIQASTLREEISEAQVQEADIVHQ